MLAVLFILGALCPLNFAVIPISLLSPEADGVLASRFTNSLLLKLPDCSTYGKKTVELLYTDLSTNINKTENFTVPSCPASQPWFLLKDLNTGTTYNMTYRTENDTSTVLTDTTTNVIDYQLINSGLPARSGAMVVITVILSLTMAILLVGFFVIVFFSG